jgi:hypothetical protein
MPSFLNLTHRVLQNEIFYSPCEEESSLKYSRGKSGSRAYNTTTGIGAASNAAGWGLNVGTFRIGFSTKCDKTGLKGVEFVGDSFEF